MFIHLHKQIYELTRTDYLEGFVLEKKIVLLFLCEKSQTVKVMYGPKIELFS